MPSLTESLQKSLDRAAALKAIDREYTVDELKEITELDSGVKTLREQIGRNDSAIDALKAISDDVDDEDDGLGSLHAPGTKGFAFSLADTGGKLAHKLAAKMANFGPDTDAQLGRKALLPAGEVATDLPLQSDSPVSKGQIASTLLDVLPVLKNAGSRYAYLRQTTRTNNAAPVAPGALKPTSVYAIERVEEDLAVIAHLSEGINKFWLQDAPSLAQFVGTELLYGLTRALEDQVLNGTGIGATMTGIHATSGVLDQTFVADATAPGWLRTARVAITRLEAGGHKPSAYVVSPEDWQEAELSRTTGGWLDLGVQPVNAATRTLWGVPVVVCQSQAQGSGVLLGTGAVAVNTDTRGVDIRWSENVGEDFERNQIRARCEGRFGVSLYQPEGVVIFETEAT